MYIYRVGAEAMYAYKPDRIGVKLLWKKLNERGNGAVPYIHYQL